MCINARILKLNCPSDSAKGALAPSQWFLTDCDLKILNVLYKNQKQLVFEKKCFHPFFHVIITNEVPGNDSAALRRVHTEPVNVYVTVPSPFSVLPLFGGDGNLNVRGSH